MRKAIKYTQITIFIDLIIALCVFIWISWEFGPIQSLKVVISDLWFNLVFAIFCLVLCSYYFGRLMNKLICNKRWNSIVVGIIGMLLVLLTGTIGGSTVGFIEEGIISNNSLCDSIFDYYYKPLYWIFLFGSIPTIISGAILGFVIKLKTCYNNV